MCSIGLGLATVLMTALVMPKHLKPAMLATLAPLPVPPIRVREIDLLNRVFIPMMSLPPIVIWHGDMHSMTTIANASFIAMRDIHTMIKQSPARVLRTHVVAHDQPIRSITAAIMLRLLQGIIGCMLLQTRPPNANSFAMRVIPGIALRARANCPQILALRLASPADRLLVPREEP